MSEISVGCLPESTVVRFAWDDDPWHETLRRVNDRAQARSRCARESWIPGLAGHLRSDITDVVPLTRRTDAPLYGRTQLSADLARLDVVDTLRIYHDGQLIAVDPFLQRDHVLHRPGVVNVAKMLSFLADGYTFNVGTIERWNPPRNSIAEHLERVLGGSAEVHAFLSGGETAASPLHFDQPELLVVPVEGDKRWDVRRSEHEFAMGPTFIDHGEPPVAFDRVVSVGQALVVPRGWLHKATPVGHVSICLTFGLFRGFLARAAGALADRAIEVDELRRPSTLGWDGDRDLVGEAVDAVSGSVSRLFDVDALQRVVARSLAELPTRNDGTVPWDLADAQEVPVDTRVRSRAPGGYLAVDVDRGYIGCAGGDRLIVASGDLRDELGALLDSNGRSLEELAGESDRPSDLLTAGARLVADGVLDICPPSGFGSDAGRSE